MHRKGKRGYKEIIFITMPFGPFLAFNASATRTYLITYKRTYVSFKGK